MLNQSSIPRINSTWLWYIILFIHCWVCFANTFLRIFIFIFLRDIFCCCLVIKSYPALSDSMDCSTSGFLVLHYFLQFAQTHVPWVGDAIQPCHPLSPSSPPALSLSQHQSWFFASGGQSIGASALASILPMNIQDWFPLGLTGFISLQSKGLLRVFLREILVCSFLFSFNVCIVLILGLCWPHRWIRKYSLSFCLLAEIIQNWYNHILKCLVEFTNEPIWACHFLFLKVMNYSFNFLLILLMEAYLDYFFLCEFWQIMSFKELDHFI